MKSIKAVIGQIRPTLGNVEKNLSLHLEAIAQAVREQADLIVFPELGVTGYQLRDMAFEVSMTLQDEPVRRLVEASREIDIVFSFVEESREHIFYITAVYASEGKIVHKHRKVYLPTYGMFEEMRHFGRGDRFRAFETRFGRVGLLICEDAWHPSAPYLLVQDGAEMLIVIASGPARGASSEPMIGSERSWYSMLGTYAQFFTSFVLFVNRVGFEDGVTFFGRSALFDPFGRVQAQAKALDPDLLPVEIEGKRIRRARFMMPLLRDENIDVTIQELSRIRKRKLTEDGADLTMRGDTHEA
jgi:predicted amidohydrolase